MEFDDILEGINGFGIYQAMLLFLLGCGEFFGIEALLINFIGGDQDHWCRIQELENLSHQRQKLIAIPMKSPRSSRCEMFPLNYSDYSLKEYLQWNKTDRRVITETFPNENDYVFCQNGWIFDQSVFVSTITQEWNLVCGFEWMVQFTSTVYMLGRVIGSFSSGILSDKIGRKKTMFIYLWIKICGSIIQIFAPNYIIFCIGRVLLAAGTTGNSLAAYVLGYILVNLLILAFISFFGKQNIYFFTVCEIIGKDYRAAAGLIWKMLYGFGHAALPGVAYFIRDHFRLQLVMGTPSVVLLSYFM